MNIYKKLCIVSLCLFVQPVIGMDFDPEITEVSLNNNNRAMLILLDDSESDDATDVDRRIGAIYNCFLSAFFQQAGPLIVSASILDNARPKEELSKVDILKLAARYQELEKKASMRNDAETKEFKNILRNIASFDKETAALWIIKKITPELYLLLPKRYLKEFGVAESDVEQFIAKGPLTTVEQELGLKVNHMQTVADIDEIKRPLPVPQVAQYFVDALYDNTKEDPSSIFVLKSEYKALKNSSSIPIWSIWIGGHGVKGIFVADLLISQFKSVLNFLEQGIRTKLLYYFTCFGAGVTNKALYEDVKNGIDRTYSFAIITQAITDTAIIGIAVRPVVENGHLNVKLFQHYRKFIDLVNDTGIIDYKVLADCFIGNLQISGVGSLLPQVKLPGLPWFSVIHGDRVCSIGTILAKTRTQPLNVETFCARQGKKAAPLGILLYADDLPFELIINPTTELGLPSTVISMIPGNAIHHLHKISSSVFKIEQIIGCFTKLEHLGAHKLFIIDEIEVKRGWFSTAKVQNIVVELTPQRNTVYYLQNGKLCKNMVQSTSDGDSAQYVKLLSLLKSSSEIFLSEAEISRVKADADVVFLKKMSSAEAYQVVVKLLDTMPNGMMLRVPKLKGISCPPRQECWMDFLAYLMNYDSLGAQKILWIDEVELYNQIDESMVSMKNIIIDVRDGNTTLFITSVAMGSMIKLNLKTGFGPIQEDYVPEYRIMLDYFNVHKQMPQRIKKGIVSTQDLLTPSAIANIRKVQEKKAQKIGEQRSKEQTTKYEQNRPWWWVW